MQNQTVERKSKIIIESDSMKLKGEINLTDEDVGEVLRIVGLSKQEPAKETKFSSNNSDVEMFCSCGNKAIKNGHRISKLRITQKYLCKNCNKTFISIGDDDLERSKFPWEVINFAMEYIQKGCSLRKIAKLIQIELGIKVHPTTIHYWKPKYSYINEER